MKITAIFAVMLLLTIQASEVRCELVADEKGYSGEAVGEGMEERKIGDATVVIPKGSKIYQENNVYTYETSEAFTTRRFDGVEKRLRQIEKDNRDLKMKLGAMRNILLDIKKGLSKEGGE